MEFLHLETRQIRQLHDIKWYVWGRGRGHRSGDRRTIRRETVSRTGEKARSGFHTGRWRRLRLGHVHVFVLNDFHHGNEMRESCIVAEKFLQGRIVLIDVHKEAGRLHNTHNKKTKVKIDEYMINNNDDRQNKIK